MSKATNPSIALAPQDAGGRESDFERRVLAARFRTIVEQFPQGIASTVAMGVLGAAVFWGQANRPALLASLVLLCIAWASSLMLYRRYRSGPPPAERTPRWLAFSIGLTVWEGCAWGLFSLAVFSTESFAYQVLDMAFMFGLISGGSVMNAPHFRSVVAFAVPTMVPVVVRSLMEGTPTSLGLAAAGLVGLAHNLISGRHWEKTIVDSIRARFENADLLRALAQERESAVLARNRAEEANREKSRFLAAASHDLRQPLHALGLFVSAAKAATGDDERRRLVDRIEASTASLTELFNSLMEMSRLDSATLNPQVRPVALRKLAHALETEFSAEARVRNLRLRLRVVDLRVASDPHFLERILRNLVANAFRHTERGGVLLSCRKRGGNVRIEVWDTGIGIAPEHHESIFEEFFQLGNPERDRRKGVGLGLAIVKRCAAMLGHPLDLRSQPGRGSRFGITLPLVSDAEALGEGAVEQSWGRDSLFGAMVVVIEDESDNREALRAPLRDWGCVAVVAESVDQVMTHLESLGRTPDLIVSDFRLRENYNGVQAIHALRLKYRLVLPAVIVTGDVRAARAACAGMEKVTVVSKPLSANLLQEALKRALT